MAEFALATGILQVAAMGITLVREMYEFSSNVASASEQIEFVAKNVSLYCAVLKALGKYLQQNHSDHTQEAEDVAIEVKHQSENLFGKIKRLLPTAKDDGSISSTQKLAWSFRKTRVDYLISQLECLKSTMGLLLHILTSTPKLRDYRSTETPSVQLKEEVVIEIQEGKNLLFEHCAAYSRAKAVESVQDEYVTNNSRDRGSSVEYMNPPGHSTSSSVQLVLSRNFSTTLVSIHAKISTATAAESKQIAITNSSLWLSELYMSWANTETQNDLAIVLGRSRPFHEAEVQPELERHQRGFAKFSGLWLLFKPDLIVFAMVKGEPMFFKVLSLNREIDNAGIPGCWSIIVWSLYCDGHLLQRQARCFRILEFNAEREIRRLPVKPIEYLQPYEQETKENCISRGKTYYDFVCQLPLLRQYNGPINGDEEDQYSGNVVIDPARYLKEKSPEVQVHRNFETMFGTYVTGDTLGTVIRDPPNFDEGPYADLDGRVCSKSDPLNDEEYYLLLPSHIQGYALERKEWLMFSIASFTDHITDRPWESLVIDPRDLEMLQSVMTGQYKRKIIPNTADFIAGKGHCQVILLHGPPGVGKTMTVECIAFQMARPLLPLSVVDVGTEERSVAANLAKYLNLATRWGAIVLIDDVETLLLQRHEGGNFLVTAFLRALEYHKGVIFLTTKEPERIAEAVRSRTTLAIEYRPFDREKRRKVWIAHMRQLHRQQQAPSWPEEIPKVEIDSMTQEFIMFWSEKSKAISLRLNGRDIRDAFQTATTIARYDAERQAKIKERVVSNRIELTPEHFKRAMEAKTALKRAIARTEGLGRRAGRRRIILI